jgi:predicted hotdog family 3-hydroxylacyl-ACP dehydratase
MLAVEVLSLIPQKAPFVFIDKLLDYDECGAKTSFKIKAENVLVVNGMFTEAGIMENIAQTAAARAGRLALKEGKPVIAGYIGSVKNFEVFNVPKVNEELITEIKIENQVFNITIISGIVTCNNVLIAQCEMNIFIGS